MVLGSMMTNAQPVHSFSVKIGIDHESVDSLGGRENVERLITDMFRRINKAFNYDARFDAIYHFEVDWDAFYIYQGISTREVFKPHPDHDYLVVMDGYKSDPKEQGGGWYGDKIQTVYHARTHNDRFNSPFEPGAIDGIIHEFGHARGIPDIYAMKVDADKNPINGQPFLGTRCIMDYPYGETYWSDYAVNMINMAGGRNIDIDDVVMKVVPDNIVIKARWADGKAVEKASVKCYPVGWYSYTVQKEPVFTTEIAKKGEVKFSTENVFSREKEFGVKYSNCLVEVEAEGKKGYAWIPLYYLQNCWFDGKDSCELEITLKRDIKLTRDI
jgi:hypothetical protein